MVKNQPIKIQLMNLKTIQKLIIIALLSMIAASSANAASIFTEEEIASTVSQKEVEQKPIPVSQKEPQYTADLKGLSGNVYVAFIVNKYGNPKDIRCIKSTDERLNDSVMDAISDWKFEPGRQNGEVVPVRCVIKIRVDFA
jgi:TonB family protein